MCVYVCMYVCIYVSMYVCMYVYVCVCACVCVSRVELPVRGSIDRLLKALSTQFGHRNETVGGSTGVIS